MLHSLYDTAEECCQTNLPGVPLDVCAMSPWPDEVPISVMTDGGECPLPLVFEELYLSAMDALDAQLRDQLVQRLDSIGFAPLGTSLLVSEVMDLKSSVTDRILGTPEERKAWFSGHSDRTTFDLAAELEANAGAAGIDITVACTLGKEEVDDPEENPYRTFTLVVGMNGSEDLSLESLAPQIEFLPSSFPRLDITTQFLTVDYDFTIPVTIEHNANRFTVDQIEANLAVQLQGGVQQDLPIVQTGSINFSGTLSLLANFDWNSNDGFAVSGSYEASLMASGSADSTSVANLTLVAMDSNFFDDEPREFFATLRFSANFKSVS